MAYGKIHQHPKANSNGFGKRPKDINRTGANKGSRWSKSLLSDLIGMDLAENEQVQFTEIKNKFPKIFNGNHETNLQLFIELRQISLVFSNDERVAQKAITEIKDRIEGKPKQVNEIDFPSSSKAFITIVEDI